MQIIVFNVNGKHFALNTENIEEITKNITTTNIPNAPYGVEGLTNLRGDVIALISLSKLLHLDEDVCYNNVIIIKNEDFKAGLLINEILKVMVIDENKIEHLGLEAEKGIKGILQLEDLIVNIIDIDELLAKNEGLN